LIRLWNWSTVLRVEGEPLRCVSLLSLELISSTIQPCVVVEIQAREGGVQFHMMDGAE
jgi:hypothetical protein